MTTSVVVAGVGMIPDYTRAIALMAELGRYGRKNGVGFYRNETDPKGKPKNMPADDTHARNGIPPAALFRELKGQMPCKANGKPRAN